MKLRTKVTIDLKFHTIHIGQLLSDDGQYKIVHKLGYGGSATVWLASDEKTRNYVALKVIQSEQSSKDCKEIRYPKI